LLKRFNIFDRLPGVFEAFSSTQESRMLRVVDGLAGVAIGTPQVISGRDAGSVGLVGDPEATERSRNARRVRPADEALSASVLVNSVGVPVTVTGMAQQDVPGQLVSHSLGIVRISQVSEGAAMIRRMPHLTERTHPGYVNVWIQLAGSATVFQDGREATVGPGELVVSDTTRPYQLDFLDAHRTVVVTFPRDLIRLGSRGIAEVTARTISGGHGLGALVSLFLTGVIRQLERHELPASVQLSDAVIDLLGAMLAEQLSHLVQVPRLNQQRTLLLRIQSFIDGHLEDPDLRSEMIANAHHISERYLQKLFKSDGRTVARYIRDRRLDRCRRDLLDPRLASRPVAVVGVRWGLTSPAHFSRVFRATYGCSPREFRASAGRMERPPTFGGGALSAVP
jgi:AraC-like DNA-binding protein/mannose-6-phosphate isomerase-like protein (cupin superfamily)